MKKKEDNLKGFGILSRMAEEAGISTFWSNQAQYRAGLKKIEEIEKAFESTSRLVEALKCINGFKRIKNWLESYKIPLSIDSKKDIEIRKFLQSLIIEESIEGNTRVVRFSYNPDNISHIFKINISKIRFRTHSVVLSGDVSLNELNFIYFFGSKSNIPDVLTIFLNSIQKSSIHNEVIKDYIDRTCLLGMAGITIELKNLKNSLNINSQVAEIQRNIISDLNDKNSRLSKIITSYANKPKETVLTSILGSPKRLAKIDMNQSKIDFDKLRIFAFTISIFFGNEYEWKKKRNFFFPNGASEGHSSTSGIFAAFNTHLFKWADININDVIDLMSRFSSSYARMASSLYFKAKYETNGAKIIVNIVDSGDSNRIQHLLKQLSYFFHRIGREKEFESYLVEYIDLIDSKNKINMEICDYQEKIIKDKEIIDKTDNRATNVFHKLVDYIGRNLIISSAIIKRNTEGINIHAIKSNNPFFIIDWLGRNEEIAVNKLIIPLLQSQKNKRILTDETYGTMINNIAFNHSLLSINDILDSTNNNRMNHLNTRIDRLQAMIEKNNFIEEDFTLVFWKDIVLERENVKRISDAFYEVNIDPISLNNGNGIGDITYINVKGDLVIIEIKRTNDVFVTTNGDILTTQRKPVRGSDISQDVVKTTFCAAGFLYWKAVNGLKGYGETYNKAMKGSLRKHIAEIRKDKEMNITVDFITVTTYRELKRSVNIGKNRSFLDKIPYKEAPIIGFHLQKVNMNSFLDVGIKKLNWKFRNGEELNVEKTGFDNSDDISTIYMTILTSMIQKIKSENRNKHYKLSTMVLFDFFQYLRDHRMKILEETSKIHH